MYRELHSAQSHLEQLEGTANLENWWRNWRVNIMVMLSPSFSFLQQNFLGSCIIYIPHLCTALDHWIVATTVLDNSCCQQLLS